MWQSCSTQDQSIADMSRSVMQLLTAQQTANVQLELQTQQNQAIQITHMDALRSLAESTQQRKFDHIFISIPIYDGTNREVFLEWVKRLEAACLQSGRDSCMEALGKAEGNVRTFLMELPVKPTQELTVTGAQEILL